MNIRLRINGRWIQAQRGQTVLDAARAHDIFIPTLCDLPGLPSQGSCRMCVVEIQGRTNNPTACTTPVEDGMVVETDTERLRLLRQDLLRMLLAEHPSACLFCPEVDHCQDCMVTLRKSSVVTGCRSCPADGQCTLQTMVRQSGLTGVAYPARYRALPVEKADPFFDRDYNLCILCGRCIRVCEQAHFNHIPVYVQRGSLTRVGTNFGLSHLAAGCSFCGACVDACPTGALWEKTRKWEGTPQDEISGTCPFCSLGCQVRLLVRDGAVIGALPGEDQSSLCVLGRFSVPELVNHPQRLARPRYIHNGQSTELSWDEACQAAAQGLAGCDPRDFALVISAGSSIEDLHAASQFASRVMRSPNLYLSSQARYGSRLAAAGRLLGLSQPLSDLDGADLLLCLGVDLSYFQSPVEGYLLRARQRGAHILTINTRQHVPGRFADLWLRPPAGSEAGLLGELAGGVSDDPAAQRASRLLHAAHKPVLIVGSDYLASLPGEVEALHAAVGGSLVVLAGEANLAGALRLGYGQSAACPPPRTLVLIGTALPPEYHPDTFVIFLSTHAPEGGIPPGLRSGLVLPMAAFCETDGSLVDACGSLKPLPRAVPPPGEALAGWQILSRIARALGDETFTLTGASAAFSDSLASPIPAVRSFPPPDWLPAPPEQDDFCAPLSEWVEGLRDLNRGAQRKEAYVPPAGE